MPLWTSPVCTVYPEQGEMLKIMPSVVIPFAILNLFEVIPLWYTSSIRMRQKIEIGKRLKKQVQNNNNNGKPTATGGFDSSLLWQLSKLPIASSSFWRVAALKRFYTLKIINFYSKLHILLLHKHKSHTNSQHSSEYTHTFRRIHTHTMTPLSRVVNVVVCV